MTSYMNPSKKVTDILSKFFDFDPSELELGIWSGDLQLSNIKLRQEAIHPLLNRKANKPHLNPLKKAPLHMRLVSGTVGNMRMRIPWKRLVWGQGDVQLEVSDVMIVLSLQSREETEEQRRMGLVKERKKKDQEAGENKVSASYRDAKQRRLREAERRHLQGMPVALYLDTLHRKNSIARDAAKLEEAAKVDGNAGKSTSAKKPGKLDKWLKKTGSDFFWRFFSGIQGSITKARIVIIQDGVEVGCIIQSVEISAGKDGTQVSVNMDDSSHMTDEARSAAEMTPPEDVAYESAYEDGEHVDKTIKQRGMGIFIRKEVNMAKVPKALRFSTSVSADDYILRPVDVDISFTFFYPFPPERRKKGIDNRSNSTPTTTASTSGTGSLGEHTSASSKQRRGKRDKDRVAAKVAPATNTPVGGTRTKLTRSVSSGTSQNKDSLMPLNDPDISRLRNRHRRIASEQGTLSAAHRKSAMRSSRSTANSVRTGTHETINSEMGTNGSANPDQSLGLVPKLDCHVTLQQISVVFTTRHYELLNYFLSVVSRMKNGRPDQSIHSTPKETNTDTFRRKFMETPETMPSKEGNEAADKSSSVSKAQNANALKAMLAPMSGLILAPIDIEVDHKDSLEDPDGQQWKQQTRSIRAQSIRKWWKYSIGAILWEIQKRKHLTTNFRQMYISFDWKKQKRQRKEYVELYISKKLAGRKDSAWPFEESGESEATLLSIEDDLPLEQILLYRSIARSIHVRGMKEMPDSMLDLQTMGSFNVRDRQGRRSMANSSAKEDEFGDDTLLSLVQRHFQAAAAIRQPGGILKKFRSLDSTPKVSSIFNTTHDSLFEQNATPDDFSSSGWIEQPKVSNHSFDISADDGNNISARDGNHPVQNQLQTPTPLQRRRASIGNDNSNAYAGTLYSSAIRRDADGRTIRTFQRKDAKSARMAQTRIQNREDTDERMKVSLAFSVATIEIIVVEEEYVFDISPEQIEQLEDPRKGSVASMSRDYYSGDDESSSDNVSDLSILTDDERFFDETGQALRITEEEEDEGAGKMSSTDFLRFGLPENPLLRLTVNSLGCTVRGRSGGRLDFGVTIRSLLAESENSSHIFSMGIGHGPNPVAEVQVVQTSAGRQSIDDFGESLQGPNMKSVKRSIRALTLFFSIDEKDKDIRCDIMKIALTADLTPVLKAVSFYSNTEIKFPDRIVEKSSRDVARKFMVYKTSSQQGKTGSFNASLKIQDIEIRVPFSYDHDTISEEHSDVEMSQRYDEDAILPLHDEILLQPAFKFSIKSLEFYSGSYVDSIAVGGPTNDAGAIGSTASLFSGSIPDSQSHVTMAPLEMIDIVELLDANDSFACKNALVMASGINCFFETVDGMPANIFGAPVAIESLLTFNETSLLETELPKTQVVVEISPVEIVLSRDRLEMFSLARSNLDYGTLVASSSSEILKKIRKPDPPRIEILTRRILHSLDLNCRRAQITVLRDHGEEESRTMTPSLKETIMEECLSDFLSIVACFDFTLPNEEAISSATQVCICRLMGLGMSDEEAWDCTNTARLNFLDDIALMRQTQSDVVDHIPTQVSSTPKILKLPLDEVAEASASSSSGSHLSPELPENSGPSIDYLDPDEQTDDDDISAQSAEIVDNTVQNAVDKTVATFAPIFQAYRPLASDLKLNTIISLEFPQGFRLSSLKLFYDYHLAVLAASIVVRNSAGIEMLTVVPCNGADEQSLDSDLQPEPGHSLSFSRYDFDADYEFGEGGLPMSALAVDDDDVVPVGIEKKRARFDDIGLGDVEILFSSNVVESIIDDLSQFGSNGGGSKNDEDLKQTKSSSSPRPQTETSLVLMASSMSAMFTNDELIPFTRLTLERVAFRNGKALTSEPAGELPSWRLVAENACLHNLTPAGQFYPEILSMVRSSTVQDECENFPFRLQYFRSADSWQTSSRLDVEFDGFQLFLIRQFIHELLQFFVYDRDGIGRLKKKYSTDTRDRFGNQKPPLLWSVKIRETSVICPRSSTDSDMVAFEVGNANVAVSYIPESFEMPTENSSFCPVPQADGSASNHFAESNRQDSSLAASSEYFECFQDPEYPDVVHGREDEANSEPISSHSQSLRKRIGIDLKEVRVYTTTAANSGIRDLVESPLFRFLYFVDGRAGPGKRTYTRKTDIELPSHVNQGLEDLESIDQCWDEISTQSLDVEAFVDYAPHMRLFIGSRNNPFTLEAKMSQLCLLLSVWDSNMQEQPTIFPFPNTQVSESASPPEIPKDFPEYGTEAFVAHLEDTSSTRSEICCIFKQLSLRCTYDNPGTFSVDPGCFKYVEDPSCADEDKPGVVLSLEDATIHVINDFLNVRRIAIGASYLEIQDERRHLSFQKVLSTSRRANGTVSSPAWADVSWGLHNDVRTLRGSLPMPVIFTVFMTPGWSMINVGADSLNGIMHDLSWIWFFLDYFKSYYTEVAFGNLGHQAQRWVHKIKNTIRKSLGQEPSKFEPLPGVNVDFRLWLCRPVLILPSEYTTARTPSLRIDSRTGLWYRYKSVKELSSQEVSTTELNLHFSNEFRPPESFRKTESRQSNDGSRSLIQGLSFGLRYDSNNICNHKDVAVVVPFVGANLPDLSVAGKELDVKPIILPSPIICKPVKSISRRLGPSICEITGIVEVLPTTINTLVNFFKGPPELNEDFCQLEEDNGPVTFSVSANISDLRLFAIDPVLGVQLPVAVVSIASLNLCATKFDDATSDSSILVGESPSDDFQLSVMSHLWADYFKLGLTRSWEPLIEPFDFLVAQEHSRMRGRGITFEADSPFHVNFSGALLQVFGETLETFSTLVKDTFGEKGNQARDLKRASSFGAPSNDRLGKRIEDLICSSDEKQMIRVLHEIPKPLKAEDRVAFSMRNLTGQKIRVHQQNDHNVSSLLARPTVVSYLEQRQTMGLTFAATISMIKNLAPVEVPYPGLPNSPTIGQSKDSLTHAIDLQVPGFRWLQGIKVDTFGRRFETLTPRSDDVLSKISMDWRLRNALMLLTEIGLDNGGRLVTVRSLFEVTNNTTHPIKLVFDPDPRRHPTEHKLYEGDVDQRNDKKTSPATFSNVVLKKPEEIETIHPGATFQVPTLLLHQALQTTGSHLGCFWLCPFTNGNNMSYWDFFRSSTMNASDDSLLEASFCSKPIQLAKIVHETSMIFQDGDGEDILVENAASGIQVSCPTKCPKGEGRAPFCYAIEVGRSPLVSVNKDDRETEHQESADNAETKKLHNKKAGDRSNMKIKQFVHAPVAYSLSIYPPLVIVNLLPAGGRFELMHAVRKSVVWYADLKPGQQVPVHSVGLDAPLLLLVNLGFCRTPVGEGALIHHGADARVVKKGDQGPRLRSIGKAALKGTKKIGRTLTAMSESPDRRGQGRMAKIKAPQMYEREKNRVTRKTRTNQTGATSSHASLGLENDASEFDGTGGKIHSVDSAAFSQDDIAAETTLVDGIGQRISLNLENLRGGGGQRRVSLFCPYWIVNTTEHSLLYKQEKSKTFVSGTVHSPDRDGSKPVDGSNYNYREQYKKQAWQQKPQKPISVADEGTPTEQENTIFAGTPGALASVPGRCYLPAGTITELIDKNLSLERMARLAFMFNFNEEGLSLGGQMLSLQLYDGSDSRNFSSEWSRGFSLESVGVSQIVAMSTKEGRTLELSAEVNVAPGFLSSYTKIVRLVPRYVVVNRLERPVRIWQDSSVFRPITEEQMAATSGSLEKSKDNRKWRFTNEDRHHHGSIEEYECLFGRPTSIDSAGKGSLMIPSGTTAHRSALYIKTVAPSEVLPFFLPDTRAERQLRLDLGGIWNISASFSSDLPGEHILKVNRATDLRMLKHVSTRVAPKYRIVLPPPEASGITEWDGELGVFFETDWGADQRIIVKGTKRGHFAFNHTDIHVGDELLRIDGISVTGMTFADAMKLIKDRMALIRSESEQRRKQLKEGTRRQGMLRRIGHKRRYSFTPSQDVPVAETGDITSTQMVLTFRTLEERLRKLRLRGNGKSTPRNQIIDGSQCNDESPVKHESSETEILKVETKSIHNTMFIILRGPDEENPPFRLQNRTLKNVICFRQRGCEGHPWSFLFPGESQSYSWEEPMKSKKLTVRVAAKSRNISSIPEDERLTFEPSGSTEIDPMLASSESENKSARIARLKQTLAYQYVDSEESGGFGPPTSVRLEEIGSKAWLPVPSSDSGRQLHRHQTFLNCEVDTDGGTRLLIISESTGAEDDRVLLGQHLETLEKQISHEEQRIAGLGSLRYLLAKESAEIPKGSEYDERISVIESDAKRFVEDSFEEDTISSRHQVVVEIIEAVGLDAADFVGSCTPYCEVFLKGRARSRQHIFQKRKNKRKTYFINKSLNPRWSNQKFVFDVPEEAVKVTRGHHLLIKVRNFRLVGQHPVLGQAAVHLGSIRSQQELVGWYPLAGRTGRNDVETVQMSDVGRGSVKLRVQWIYTSEALLNYFMILSQSRLDQLLKSRDGMTEQLSHAVHSDERRREAQESVNASGKISRLTKLQKRTERKRPSSARKPPRSEKKRRNAVGKFSQGVGSSLVTLKGTLKASRHSYLQALYFESVERSRKSDSQVSGAPLAQPEDDKTMLEGKGGGKTPDKSPDFDLHSSRSTLHSPRMREKRRGNNQTLDDFFAASKSPFLRSPYRPNNSRGRLVGSMESPHRRTRHYSVDAEISQRAVANRKLSLDLDHLAEEGSRNQDFWRSRLVGSQSGSDFSISDILSVGNEADKRERQKRNVKVLRKMGFVFHEHGVYFHQKHLPYRFRRSIFVDSREINIRSRLNRPKFAVFDSPNKIIAFRSAQAAGALFADPDLSVLTEKHSFVVHLISKRGKSAENHNVGSNRMKGIISQKLRVPDVSPITTRLRVASRVEMLYTSRRNFERTARRNLGAVLNPGGWMTVRPITALNLPDGYNGMTVKLRYGSEVVTSETVDARVAPRWGSFESHALPVVDKVGAGGLSTPFEKRVKPSDFAFSANDLHVFVEPQQTGGAMKLSVVAERLNNKTELGVLDIPLGPAIAACLDSYFDEDDQEHGGIPGVYVRWFPLMSPRLASPVEGDMGNSSRPIESEKPRDSMFEQYFTPCIQLALMWQPNGGLKEEELSARTSRKEKHSDSDGLDQSSGSKKSNPSDQKQGVMAPTVESYINADFSRVSIALIDSQRAVEVLSFTAMDIDARYSVTKMKTRTSLTVGWVQLDHQEPRAREPVILAPTPSDAMQPTLQFLALKDNERTKRNILSYEYIGVALREMDLIVEESWMFDLWDFLMGVKRRMKAKVITEGGQRTANFLLTTDNCFLADENEAPGEEETLLSMLEAEAQGGPKVKIYIEQLILGLVKVNLSYIKGKKQAFELSDIGSKALRAGEFSSLALATSGLLPESLLRGDQSEVFLRWSQHTHDEEMAVNGGYNLPGIIAAVFPSVSDAPIRLQGKVIEHAFESSEEIASSIKTFYTNETLKQVYKIIGSLDFVGNPTILFSSFVSGVRDLVAAPTSAFLKSPTNVNQVGMAVGKGTLSLFSHSTSGIFGFAAKMSATAGQAAAVLSLDKEYSQWHRDSIVSEAANLNRVWKQRGIQTFPEMIARPIGDVLLGIGMGTSGLIISPYKGLKTGGGAGFVRGVVVGTAGVVAKPIVGVLDAFTHFTATAHDLAKSVNVLERRYQPALKIRLPYIFGPMNILCPFDQISAWSAHLLRTFPVKRKVLKRHRVTKEVLVHAEVLQMEPGVDTFAIATTIRVVLIRLKKDNSGIMVPAMAWEVFHGDGATVASRLSDHGHNGVALTITRCASTTKPNETPPSKVLPEELKTSAFSSALSIESSHYSDLEEYDAGSTDEADGEITTSLRDQREHSEEMGDIEIEDPTFNQGATKKGNDVLRWFTVLAEYQHRPQLTRLHNAISALCSDFDAILNDIAADGDDKEGVTTFGIFNFERSAVDQRSILLSNAALAISLESLPWMHRDIFEQAGVLPKAIQRQFIHDIRQNWSFETDLRGSKHDGGANWLVEARARAMYSSFSPNNGSLPESHELFDPVVGEIAIEESRPNRLTFIGEEHMSDSENSLPANTLTAVNHSERAAAIPRDGNKHEESIRNHSLILSEDHYASLPMDSEGDLFHSLHQLQNISLSQKTSSYYGKMTSTLSPERSPAEQTTRFQSPVSSPEENQTTSANPAAYADSGQRSLPIDQMTDTSRMDRMESLMEQLVILNAQHTRNQTIPLDIAGDGHSLADSGVADMLKQEVAELKAQVQARAAQDDALRSEIHLLRQQLADRREQRNTKTQEKHSRSKLPQIFRFRTTKDDGDGNSYHSADSQEKSAAGVLSSSEVYDTPLKDTATLGENMPKDASASKLSGRRPKGFDLPGPDV